MENWKLWLPLRNTGDTSEHKTTNLKTMLEQRENIILTKTDAFSDRIIKLAKYLKNEKHEHIIRDQILRSGTSIAANAIESKNAQSRADFVSKLSIALKEADETSLWIKKLYVGEFIDQKGYESLTQDVTEIIKILTAIIKTCKGQSKTSS